MACGLFFGEQRPVVAERIDVEELEPGPDRCEGSPGRAQLIADVQDVVLNLSLAELIGRNHVVGSQLANSPQILGAGPFGQPGEPHVPDHALSEFCHCDTLSWMAPKNSGHGGRKLKGIRRSLRTVESLRIEELTQRVPPSRGEAASSNPNWRRNIVR